MAYVDKSEAEVGPGLAKDIQKLNCFPNDNTKHIDYVIMHKYSKKDKENEKFAAKDAIRKEFIERVKGSKIDVYTIRKKDGDDRTVFYLLSCSMDRLLDEAETVELQMKLANVYQN
jgi:ribosomal protein L21